MALAMCTVALLAAPSGAQAGQPCAQACRVRLTASPIPTFWTSPQRLRADLRVSVTVGGRAATPTYYRRHGELCIGYFAGFGTTTKIDVCGTPYRLRVTTQAFRGPKPVIVRYKAAYPYEAWRLGEPYEARHPLAMLAGGA